MVIPVGCPHQVANKKTSIKIAIDYMPVESLPYLFSLNQYRRTVAIQERATSNTDSALDLFYIDKLRAVEYLVAAAIDYQQK
jgi:hypothetical protein